LLLSSGSPGTIDGFIGAMKRATSLSGFSFTPFCISGWMMATWPKRAATKEV